MTTFKFEPFFDLLPQVLSATVDVTDSGIGKQDGDPLRFQKFEQSHINVRKKPQDHALRLSDKDRRQRQAARFARILPLLELLQSRVRHKAGSLARELGVSSRTVQRDLDVLELAGIPCQYIA